MPVFSPPGSIKLLRNRNYLIYFSGQLISMSGTWMQSVAQAWLVYRMSHSGYWLGIITFAGQLPAFLASPFAGVLSDQFDRRKVLIWAQVISMIQAFILAALVYWKKVELSHVALLSVLLGFVNAFDMTARHAFAVDMVGKGELTSAIALNSVLINLSRVFGPVIAGALLSALGEAWCFTINGLSYIPVIWGLASMKLPPNERVMTSKHLLANFNAGVDYVKQSPVIFRILILSTFVCLIAAPYNALLPLFSERVLGGGASTLAWLTGAVGLGSVTSALLFHGISETEALKRRLIADVIFWGLGLVAFGVSKNYMVSLCALFTTGYFAMSLFPTMNNAVQHLVDDSMRGRVMSLYTMTYLGSVPIGSLVMGWFCDRYSAPTVVTGAGVLTVLMGFALTARSAFRANARRAALAHEHLRDPRS